MMDSRIGSACMPVDTHDTGECFYLMVYKINANQGSNCQMHHDHLYCNKRSVPCKPGHSDAYGCDGPAVIRPGRIDPAWGSGVQGDRPDGAADERDQQD